MVEIYRNSDFAGRELPAYMKSRRAAGPNPEVVGVLTRHPRVGYIRVVAGRVEAETGAGRSLQGAFQVR